MKQFSFAMILLGLFVTVNVFAQDDKKEKEAAQAAMVKNLVESKSFAFQAETASPLKGNIVHLSPGYRVKVMPGSINSDLPYFGQAYQATIDQTNNGYKFISSKFDYQSEVRKKGGWDITVKPQDVRNGPQLYFTIQSNGAASLRISSNDRQSISYSGVIGEAK